MNLRILKTKTLNAATAAALDTAVSAFVDTLPQATFVSIQFSAAAGFYACQIAYTS